MYNVHSMHGIPRWSTTFAKTHSAECIPECNAQTWPSISIFFGSLFCQTAFLHNILDYEIAIISCLYATSQDTMWQCSILMFEMFIDIIVSPTISKNSRIQHILLQVVG